MMHSGYILINLQEISNYSHRAGDRFEKRIAIPGGSVGTFNIRKPRI
jgi:hypothetical protein